LHKIVLAAALPLGLAVTWWVAL